jgi:hypothetical protein
MATKFWGPLGWMTLHSISSIYPENPNREERLLLEKFIEMFRDSITCPHCKSHFTGMLNRYKNIHPEWSSSRYDFFMFVCRAHNTVNRRLDKPVFPTLQSCIDRLKETTKVTSASAYRTAYINYLISNWQREMSSEGYINADTAKRMKKINEEYFTPRDTNFENFSLNKSGNVLEFIPEDPRIYSAGPGIPNIGKVINQNTGTSIQLPKVGLRFVDGKLKII